MAMMRALVVEDEPANRDFFMRLIAQAGFDAQGAATGEEALRCARAIPDLTLVMVDLQLPDFAGLELVIELRALLPDTLLLVATMRDEPSLIAQAFENGCDVFLVKPHGFMELYKRLKGLPESREQLLGLIMDQYGPRPYMF
jgi:two-component system cell cycle response regulator CtrA